MVHSKFRWYTGFSSREQQYRIGDVNYIVESRFDPFPVSDQHTLRDRVEKVVTSYLTDLTMFEQPGTIETEDVCSAAEKEG